MMQHVIEDKLSSALETEFILVENESHMHSGPKDGETHFKLTLVSENFVGLRRVARHQKVYAVLSEELAGSVHALAMHLFSPDEWAAVDAAPDSPDCLGGSKT